MNKYSTSDIMGIHLLKCNTIFNNLYAKSKRQSNFSNPIITRHVQKGEVTSIEISLPLADRIIISSSLAFDK